MASWKDKPSALMTVIVAMVAIYVRFPGLFWGFDMFTGRPFLFMSFDEYYFAHQFFGYLTTGVFDRNDYVLGFVRETAWAVKVVSVFLKNFSPEGIVLTARVMNVVFGSATAVLTYAFAFFLWGEKRVAAAAGFFIALAPLAVMHGHYATPSSSMLFWLYTTFLAFLVYRRTGNTALWYAGCFCAGAAIAVKFAFIGLVPLFFLLTTRPKDWRLWPGLIVVLVVFTYFNMGRTPWECAGGIIDFEVQDNFIERVHHRWVNPFLYLFDLLPSVGLPFLLLSAAGFRRLAVQKFYSFQNPVSRARLIMVELPLLAYFIVICFMTSCFVRHLLPLVPYLACVAAYGAVRAYDALALRRPVAGVVCAVFVLAWQLLSCADVEWQHLPNRPARALAWTLARLKPGERIGFPSEPVYKVVWKGHVFPNIVTTTIDGADYLIVSEKMSWRLWRSQATPLTTHPLPEEMFHQWLAPEAEHLREIMSGDSDFTEVARFPVKHFMPEFLLYQRALNSFNYEYGDVRVYYRPRSAPTP